MPQIRVTVLDETIGGLTLQPAKGALRENDIDLRRGLGHAKNPSKFQRVAIVARPNSSVFHPQIRRWRKGPAEKAS